jgi:hypothetical protein
VNGNKGDDTVIGHSLTGDWLLGGQGNDLIDATASTGHNICHLNLRGGSQSRTVAAVRLRAAGPIAVRQDAPRCGSSINCIPSRSFP